MEKEKKPLRPPYASSGVADAIFDLLRRIVPQKIDTKIIVDNNIATSTNAFTATDLVKWLGITDEEGNVRKEVLNKLRLVGEEREKFIKELIEKSYKGLFEKVNLREAEKDDIINYFVHNHNFGTAQARYAAALFLHLCHKYGIPVAEGLKKKTHTGTGQRKKEKKQESKKSDIKKVIGKKDKILSNKKISILINSPMGENNLEADNKTELKLLKIKLEKLFALIEDELPEEKEKNKDETD